MPLALNRSRKGLDAAPRGGGGCVREVLTQPSRNRALLWSSPPMSLNSDVSRFLLWLGRCFISRRRSAYLTRWTQSRLSRVPAIPSGGAFASAPTYVPWLCCPTSGWAPAAQALRAATHCQTLLPPQLLCPEMVSREASSAVVFWALVEGTIPFSKGFKSQLPTQNYLALSSLQCLSHPGQQLWSPCHPLSPSGDLASSFH